MVVNTQPPTTFINFLMLLCSLSAAQFFIFQIPPQLKYQTTTYLFQLLSSLTQDVANIGLNFNLVLNLGFLKFILLVASLGGGTEECAGVVDYYFCAKTGSPPTCYQVGGGHLM